MLGVPAEDRDRFGVWSARRARMLEPTITPRERAAGVEAGKAFDAWFRPIIEQRSAAPRDDIVSALVQAQHEGGRLSERETLNMLRLLVIAGNETTANLIGNGMLALLRNPDQLRRLRDDPGLIPAAVDELLRFDSPVQTDFRRVLADCEVNGFPLRARDNIVLSLGAANRDPEAFEDPDRSTSGASRGPTSRSGGVSTIASGPRSRAWRAGSRSRCCSHGSRGSSCSTSARGSAAASCSAAWNRSRCGAAGPDTAAHPGPWRHTRRPLHGRPPASRFGLHSLSVR